MGTVFKKTTTRPVPPGAEIIVRKGERFARWKARNGKGRTEPLTKGAEIITRKGERFALRRLPPRPLLVGHPAPPDLAAWKKAGGAAGEARPETRSTRMLAEMRGERHARGEGRGEIRRHGVGRAWRPH